MRVFFHPSHSHGRTAEHLQLLLFVADEIVWWAPTAQSRSVLEVLDSAEAEDSAKLMLELMEGGRIAPAGRAEYYDRTQREQDWDGAEHAWSPLCAHIAGMSTLQTLDKDYRAMDLAIQVAQDRPVEEMIRRIRNAGREWGSTTTIMDIRNAHPKLRETIASRIDGEQLQSVALTLYKSVAHVKAATDLGCVPFLPLDEYLVLEHNGVSVPPVNMLAEPPHTSEVREAFDLICGAMLLVDQDTSALSTEYVLELSNYAAPIRKALQRVILLERPADFGSTNPYRIQLRNLRHVAADRGDSASRLMRANRILTALGDLYASTTEGLLDALKMGLLPSGFAVAKAVWGALTTKKYPLLDDQEVHAAAPLLVHHTAMTHPTLQHAILDLEARAERFDRTLDAVARALPDNRSADR